MILFLILNLLVSQASAQSIEEVSARFVTANTAYVLGPLGEGKFDVFDESPLYRFDEFDCTTFVETMMALSGATDASGHVDMNAFQDRIIRIRYKDGKISYFTRNHFPEVDWIPNNAAAGWVTDVTAQLAGSSTQYSEALIDKRAWYRARTASDIRPARPADEMAALLSKLRSLGDSLLPQPAKIAFIPISALIGPDPSILKALPSGSIVNIVRENWTPDGGSTPMIISHQMILVREGEEVRLRHASPDHGVIEVGLVDYLKPFTQSATIRGINILRFNSSPVIQP